MAIAQCLAVLAFLSGPAFADLRGSELVFTQGTDIPPVTVPAGTATNGTLWDSGPSQPAARAFSGLLFQGQAEDSRFNLEAAALGPDGWGPWMQAKVKRFPNGRFWGRITLPGAKGEVLRLRLLNQGCTPGRRIEIFSLELADEGRQGPPPSAYLPERLLKGQYSAPATALRPEVISRKEWNAAKSKAPYEPMIPRRITVHHTRGPQPRDREDAVVEMQIIQQFHQKGRHWDDIGYHFLIDGNGRIYEGRPETALGAHVMEHNEDNVGIAVMGDFEKKNSHPTDEQLKALAELTRYLGAAHAIPAARLFSHKDLDKSSRCPGRSLTPHLPEIRKAMGQPEAAPAGPSLSARLDLLGPGFRFE